MCAEFPVLSHVKKCIITLNWITSVFWAITQKKPFFIICISCWKKFCLSCLKKITSQSESKRFLQLQLKWSQKTGHTVTTEHIRNVFFSSFLLCYSANLPHPFASGRDWTSELVHSACLSLSFLHESKSDKIFFFAKMVDSNTLTDTHMVFCLFILILTFLFSPSVSDQTLSECEQMELGVCVLTFLTCICVCEYLHAFLHSWVFVFECFLYILSILKYKFAFVTLFIQSIHMFVCE